MSLYLPASVVGRKVELGWECPGGQVPLIPAPPNPR
jgi:hypothetical protein